MAEETKDQVVRYLNDSYAAETGGMTSLKDLVAETTDSDVRQAAQNHIAVAQSHADKVAARIQALGGDKSEPKGIFNSVLAKASGVLNIFHSKEDKQTQDLIKLYAYEHFAVGAYTSLEAYASAVGDAETAQLARSIIADKEKAGTQFLALIPQLAVASVTNSTGTV